MTPTPRLHGLQCLFFFFFFFFFFCALLIVLLHYTTRRHPKFVGMREYLETIQGRDHSKRDARGIGHANSQSRRRRNRHHK